MVLISSTTWLDNEMHQLLLLLPCQKQKSNTLFSGIWHLQATKQAEKNLNQEDCRMGKPSRT
jgi:hypothetical protein